MILSLEEGRKEDGNRSIADKIIKRLHDLDKTVEYNQGRWAWELLQNAKDSTADDETHKISVQIILDEDQVEFKHNGIHFTEHDIRGLINQISSKEAEEGEQTRKTGRFGTGFLTTHLLSRTVQIKGVLEAESGQFYNFQFTLDREGEKIKDLSPKIEMAWNGFQESATEIEDFSLHNKNDFNTSFVYPLKSEEQKQIAQIGINEFVKLLPYVLAFIPKIESVKIIDNREITDVIFQNSTSKIDDFITPITRIEDGKESTIYILEYSGERTSIACQVEKEEDIYSFTNVETLPKLFCDFPLIGTENFNFPMVVNSFDFNPLTERNGIWLKKENDDEVAENQSLLLKAYQLYKDLMEKLSESNYSQFYNVIETKIPNVEYLNKEWFQKEIQTPMREFLMDLSIVELESGNKKAIKDIWFPLKEYSKDVKRKLWKYNYDLFPECVPKEKHLIGWSDKSWNGWESLSYEELAKDLATKEKIEELKKSFEEDEEKTFEWLNEVREFLFLEESNKLLFDKYAITPSRNGEFKTTSELFIDKIKDEELIEILRLLGDDWNDILINKNIAHGSYYTKEKKDIASQITLKVNNPSQKGEDYNKAIILLSEWFESNNPDEIKHLFSELYRKKAELFMNTILDKESLYRIMKSDTDLSKVAKVIDDNPHLLDNIESSEQLKSLLTEYDLKDISELRDIIEASKNGVFIQKSELTQEDLAGLGITSLEDLEEALKDKDLSSMFHESSSNVNAFLYAEKLILRAKQRIIGHLETLDEYDCNEIDTDISKTSIGGIKKNGQEIFIVTRPSDNNFIIVYYGSEKDILDYENAELWVDNGIDTPKRITLGRILKNTGINKIPV
ncbi:sacsin N-terminal ATP-binding-like domain-containing protein [Gaetbulibacter jejuensis]|uniref:Histidine kinase/DNA gyrase B/HSP90-like ATPase n=1 Tax=Gaetbulibacter jejuensis TaxID=584607 RepID=A0ABN1JIG6_9FLAO